MNVVLDTNVLLSGLLFRGPVSQIHLLWKKRRISPLANKAIMAEYARVLSYHKFKLSPDEIALLFDEEIFPFFKILKSSSLVLPHVPDDPSDVPFLYAAREGKARYLISGDPHLLKLNGKYTFPIVSPAVFLRKFSR